MENKLINKVNELVDYLKNQDSYKRYITLSLSLKEDKEVMKLIKEIKKIHQNIINDEYNGINTSKLELQLSKKKEELERFPLYLEYSYLQEDLNNQFQQIKSIIENEINKY